MSVNTNRIMIETIVRRAVREVKDSPRRNTRNLVDMAYQFASGRFQRYFFEMAQGVLSDENSVFFDLIYDAATHVDNERLITFGMNVGYNGLTHGAGTIRQIEEERTYNVPWIVTLTLDASTFSHRYDDYCRILREGCGLGIYCWILRVSGDPQSVLPLAAAFEDCAFFLQIEKDPSGSSLSDQVPPGFLAELASGYHNVMLVLPFDRATPDEESELFRNLREYELLYSVCCEYTPDNLSAIYDGEYFSAAEQVHAVFAALSAGPSCGKDEQDAVFSFVSQSQRNNRWRVIPWELACDNQAIDGVVSNEACTVTFDQSGCLTGADGSPIREGCLFDTGLAEILAAFFPKTAAEASPADV